MSAPYSRVATAPSPALTGTTLTVLEDEGAKFPDPPFVAVVWPLQRVPTPATSEQLEVSKKTGDQLTFHRAADPIEIEADMMIGVLTVSPVIKLGEPIRLEIFYTSDESPYTLRLQSPGGALSTATGALGTDGDGHTVAWAEVIGTSSGLWTYRWEVGPDKVATPDSTFFVSFTGSQ